MSAKASNTAARDPARDAQDVREWGRGDDHQSAEMTAETASAFSTTVVPATSRAASHASGKFHKLSRKGTMKHTATKTVTNFHQATVAFVLDRHDLIPGRSNSAKEQQRTLFAASSVIIVLIQFFTALAVMISIYNPTCLGNSECTPGRWCSSRAESCMLCEQSEYQPLCLGGISSKNNSTTRVIANHSRQIDIDLMCGGCIDEDGKLKTNSMWLRRRVRRMRLLDVTATLFALIVVSMAIINEVRDINLCRLAQLQYERQHATLKIHILWKVLLTSLSFVRLHVTVPMMVGSQDYMLSYGGMDAVSICMNSIALVFILDIDEAAYFQVLSHRVHNYFERNSLITITRHDEDADEKTNYVMLFLIPMSVVVILFGFAFNVNLGLGVVVAFPLVAGALRVYVGTYGPSDQPKQMGLLLVRSLMGGAIIILSVYITETVYIDWVEVDDPGEDYRPGFMEKMRNNAWVVQGSAG